MIRMNNKRKLMGLSLQIDDVMEILLRTGCLLWTGNRYVSVPADARVTASVLSGGEVGGAAQLRITLESDNLDDTFLFDGSLYYCQPIWPAPLPAPETTPAAP